MQFNTANYLNREAGERLFDESVNGFKPDLDYNLLFKILIVLKCLCKVIMIIISQLSKAGFIK